MSDPVAPATSADILGDNPTPVRPPSVVPPLTSSSDVLEDADRFKVSVSAGIEQDPKRAARIIAAQQRTGLPSDLIARNLDAVEQASRRQGFDADAYRRQAPFVSRWLSEDPSRVGLTQDDLPRLALLEQAVRADPRYTYSNDGTILEELPGGYANVYQNAQDLRRKLTERGVAQDVLQRRLDRVRRDFGETGAALASGFVGSVAATTKALGANNRDFQEGSEALTSASSEMSPGLVGRLERGIGAAAADLPLMFLGGPVAKLSVGLSRVLSVSRTLEPFITGAAAIQPLALRSASVQGQEQGFGQGLASWAIDTGIAGAFGPVGISRATVRAAGGDVPSEGALSAANLVLKHAGLQGAQNVAFDLAHSLEQYATGADKNALDWDRLGPQLVASGVLGSLLGTAFTGAEAWSHVRTIQDAAGPRLPSMLHALSSADQLRRVAETAQDNQGLELNQPAIRDLVGKLAEDSGIKTLYIDSEQWAERFKDKAGAAATELLGDSTAYDRASSAGTQMAVPLEAFYTTIARGEHNEWFMGEARTAPDAPNQRETLAELERLKTQATGAAEPMTDMEAGADLVHEDVRRQLIEAGTDQTAAEHQAMLWRQVFHTAAVNLGGKTDPYTLYSEQKVKIQRGLAKVFQSEPMKDALDAAIERLKAGDIPTEKQAADSLAAGEPHVEKQRRELVALLEHLRTVGADIGAESASQLKARVTEAPEEGGQLEQPGDVAGEPRGNYLPKRLSKSGENLIKLFKGADRSTFIHESGHFLLEFMHDIAARTDAPHAMKDDLAKVREWLDAKGSEPLARAQHELFARGFETYLMEGKAPSTALRSAFQRFASWLADVYKAIKGKLGVHLTDEVRGVLDRLVATGDEIRAAQAEGAPEGVFQSAEEAGWTEGQWNAYQSRLRESLETGRSLLEAEALRSLRAAATETYQEERAKVSLEVAERVNQRKNYTALLVLQRGAWPEGIEIPEGSERIKLDRRGLAERYGEAGLKLLPGPKREGEPEKANSGRTLYAEQGGIDLDAAAVVFGYPDGNALWEALINAPDRRAVIEGETDAAMLQRHPDPMLDGTLHEKARISVANDPRMEVMAREAEALARKRGKAATPSDLLRAVAIERVRNTTARNLRPDVYRVAMNKAGRAALKASIEARHATEVPARSELLDEALTQKNREILNAHLYRESERAKTRSEKGQKYLAKFDTIDVREKLGKAGGFSWAVSWTDPTTQASMSEEFPTQEQALQRAKDIPGVDLQRTGYLEQIDQILEGFDLRRASNNALRRRENLRQWIQRQAEAEEPVAIPDEVVRDLGRRNWRDLSVAEQGAVVDAVRNIEHLARMKNKLLANEAAKDMETARVGIVGAIEKNSRGRVVPPIARTDFDKTKDLGRDFLASHVADADRAYEMDGYQYGGTVWDYLIRPRNEKADTEALRIMEATARRDVALQEWHKGGVRGHFRETIPGTKARLTREQMIGVALNWGNKEGRQRVLDNLHLEEKDALAVLDALDAKDWALVKETWKHAETFWPEIAALEERTTGIKPERVESIPFVTKHGIMPGGYYPIKYDGELATKAGDVEGAEEAKRQLRAAYGSPQTRRNFTKQRTKQVADRSLRLDFGVFNEHLTEVVHDLTHREMLIDQRKLLRDGDISRSIIDHYGRRALQQFTNTTADIALGDVPAKTGLEKGMRALRQNAPAAVFGFNLTSALANVSGISQAMVRTGVGPMLKSVAATFRDAASLENTSKWVQGMSDFMRERAQLRLKSVREATDGVGATSWIKDVQAWGMYPMHQVQKAVDTLTWRAAYEHQRGLNVDEAKAIAIADQVVRDTQSSQRIGDKAPIQRGGELHKLMTTFYSYFGRTYNLQRAIVNQTAWTDPASVIRFGTASLLNWTIPALVTGLVTEVLRGSPAGQDDEKLAKRMAMDQVMYGAGMVVGLREISAGLQGFGYHGPAGVRSFDALSGLAGQVSQGKADAGLAKSLVAAMGVMGVPSVEAQRLLDAYLVEDARGSHADAIRSALFGKPRQ